MTIQRTVTFIVALLMLSLGGCALFGDKQEKSPAKLRAALEVPPDLARPASDDLAAVPPSGAAAYSDYAAKSSAPPAGNVGLASTNVKPAETASASVRLGRDGAQRWLVLQDSTERVWVQARDYFLRNNIALSVDNPRTGVLETDWIDRPVKFSGVLGKFLASASSTGLRDKLRVRVEQGRAPGTTEVTVSHQGLTEEVAIANGVNVMQTVWQPRPADREMEAEVLAKLMVHFGVDEQQAKGQVAAADPARAQLAKGELLLLQDDLDAAWRRVGQALDRTGVITEDRDRNAGIFYVRYVDSSQAGKRQGIFSWLSRDSNNPAATPGSRDNDAVSTDRFQIRLKAAAIGISVKVFNVNGEPEESKTGERLLDVLYQQLR